jgi:hypothetical protein
MRPRKVKRGDKVYEMRVRKNGSQTPAPGQALSLPNQVPSTAPTTQPVQSLYRKLGGPELKGSVA